MTIQQDKFVPDMVNATNVMKKVWLQGVLAIMDGKARIVLVQLKKSLARTKKPDKYAWEMDNANVTMVNDASVMKGTVENTATNAVQTDTIIPFAKNVTAIRPAVIPQAATRKLVNAIATKALVD